MNVIITIFILAKPTALTLHFKPPESEAAQTR